MAKLRFLMAVYLPTEEKSVNFNDELDIENEKLVDYLLKNGLADKLIDAEKQPKDEEKEAKKAPKRAKKQPEIEVN